MSDSDESRQPAHGASSPESNAVEAESAPAVDSAAPTPASGPAAAGPPPGYPPIPPAGPGVPPAYAWQYGPPPGAPRKRGRAWIWWLAGALVMVVSISFIIWAVAALSGDGGDGFGTGNIVAVIPFDGTIAGTGAGGITPQGFLEQLQRAEDDSDVKAIVLRVDSPGGTVAASEEIATYVKQAKKPIVVSVGDVDASGAYMVSSQADRIIANPGSAIGSIGVITEIPNVSGLADKLGISFKVITAGKYKDAGSPFRPLTPEETAMLQGQVDAVYEQFIDIVAEGRKMPKEEVRKLATGWAWNAVEAKKLGLVDQIGTYQDATKAAAKLGKIEGDNYDVVVYDKQEIGSILNALLGIESQLKNLSAVGAAGTSAVGKPVMAK
jgi:protease IV